MPQIIVNKDQGSPPANKRPDRPDDPESKKRFLIGAGAVGVLVLAIIAIMLMRPKTVPREEKVPPPPGMPDTYPYNSKEWQQRRPTIGGMPPPSVLNQFKNQPPPKQ
jgi:hypothetical protein